MTAKGPHLFASLNTSLADVAVTEQLIQPLKVLDVSSKVIQEHDIKENSHDLR